MKILASILFLCVMALSWQLDKTAGERDEAHAMVQDALDLIPRWENQAKHERDKAEYWYTVHLDTVLHYERLNRKADE